MTKQTRTKKQNHMTLALQDTNIKVCRHCKTVYMLEIFKPGVEPSSGRSFCPNCNHLTNSIPLTADTSKKNPDTRCVLITLSGGLIDQVDFFDNPFKAKQALVTFVKRMDPENQDAGVYNPEGLITNAKEYLDEDDCFPY